MVSILKAEQISKSFNEHLVLSNVYFGLATGEILGVFGRNGSGKSTLFSILFGTLKADQIFLFHNGKPIRNRRQFRKLLSLSTQVIFLPDRLKLKNVIEMLVTSKNKEQLLLDSYLSESLEQTISELPLGLVRYIQSKCILYNHKPFCLLDEPFSGLSPILTKELKLDIQKQSQHKGIAIIDHNYQEVLDISTKNMMLKNASSYNLSNSKALKELGYIIS